MIDTKGLRIDTERLWADVMALAALTDPDKPYTRRSFSPRFDEGRRWLDGRFRQAGLATRIDAGGNLIGRREGDGGRNATLMLGSHSDTVPSGGRFDGIAGLVSALEVARVLGEAGIGLAHPLEIVDFLAEEPSEFGLSCIGSRAMAGVLTADMLALRDGQGRVLGAAIDAVGGDVARLDTARRDDIAAFLELHIEQGVVLERAGIDVGVVTGLVGIARFEIVFSGLAAHAGTTPMHLRKDAGVAAADTVVQVACFAAAHAKKHDPFVATCGVVEQWPNAANIVPERARIVVDARAMDHAVTDEFHAWLEAAIVAIATRHGCAVVFRVLSDTQPTPSDGGIQALLAESASARGISTRPLASGAGHDAAFIGRLAPMGMVFVPSKDGRSHCPEEWTEAAEIVAGATVLLEAVLRLDAQVRGLEPNGAQG
jgi:N-carbamoyl-L-amino-acid hydrolase